MPTTTTVKTSELSDKPLDWAVAYAESDGDVHYIFDEYPKVIIICRKNKHSDRGVWDYRPSKDWSHGGSIIEREKISVTYSDGYVTGSPLAWYAEINFFYDGMEVHGDFTQKGETPLTAAMRCYVASKLGETVDVPTELLK